MRAKQAPQPLNVHCVLCGKTFRSGAETTCGGRYNGKPLCNTRDIQRALEKQEEVAHG